MFGNSHCTNTKLIPSQFFSHNEIRKSIEYSFMINVFVFSFDLGRVDSVAYLIDIRLMYLDDGILFTLLLLHIKISNISGLSMDK